MDQLAITFITATTALVVGANAITATLTDTAGNVSAPSAVLNVTLHARLGLQFDQLGRVNRTLPLRSGVTFTSG